MPTTLPLPLFVARTVHLLPHRLFVIRVGAGKSPKVKVGKSGCPMASRRTFFALIERNFEYEGLGTSPPPRDEGLLMQLCEAFSIANEFFRGEEGKKGSLVQYLLFDPPSLINQQILANPSSDVLCCLVWGKTVRLYA